MSGYAPTPIEIRIWQKVDRSGGPDACWPFTGYKLPKGYGTILVGSKAKKTNRQALAHRVAWEVTHGPIPPGLGVLHRCDNPPCCNPSHLFLGDQFANMQDAASKGRTAHGPPKRDACKKGHPLTDDNVYVKPNGNRQCLTCKREAQLAWQRRHKDKMAEYNRANHAKRKLRATIS